MPENQNLLDNQKILRKIKNLTRENQHLKAKIFKIHHLLVSLGLLENQEGEVVESFLPIVKKINPDSDILVLAFGGMLSNLGMPPAEFLKSLTSKKCSCVFLKDFHQCWYQKGLLGLTNDIYETRDLIKSIIMDLAPNNIVAVGTSAGGYAAIMFGTLLGVQRVLAFAPQTKVGHQIAQKFGSLDTPNLLAVAKTKKVIFDLVELIDENPKDLPETHIYFGELSTEDKIHAERLSRFSNVKLHSIRGEKDHNIARSLKQEGKLDEILDDAIKFDRTSF
jgi:predicted esterase YcpF (UPF0227 family)